MGLRNPERGSACSPAYWRSRSMVAVTALVIGIWPNFPLVFTALVLHGTTGERRDML